MKKMKKLASVLLALVMVVAMAMPVFATEVTSGTSASVKGQITIDKATVGQTYDLYRVFELESYNTTSEVYTYKIVEEWRDFFTTGAGNEYVTIDSQGYVTWKAEDSESAAAGLAKAAIAYAKATENIKLTATQTPAATFDAETNPEGLKAGDETKITFTELPLGYYLVDSTVGTLCNLTTTNNVVNIEDKNIKPEVDKEVKEDSTGEYGKENDAEIGQIVEYKTTITAQSGAINYILHDKMDGLDFVEVTKVTLQKAGTETEEVREEGIDYKVKSECVKNKGCSFDVVFESSFTDGLGNGDLIIVYYTAKVNASAVVAGTGNPNETSLTYGENSDNETDKKETHTYTFKFDLVKTTDKNVLLNGATFKLYTVATGGTAMKFVYDAEEKAYRVATEKDTTTTENIEVVDGKVTIVGLDGDSKYYLEETVAPDGYNKLESRVEVTLSKMVEKEDGSKDVNIVGAEGEGANEAKLTNDSKEYESGGVKVENKAGSLLPSTGGIGTTIFYVVGTILVLGAGILLVTKRRMKAQ